MRPASTGSRCGRQRTAPGLVPPLVALCLFGVVTSLLSQTAPVFQGKEEKLPKTVAPQPVPFSHKKHTEAGMSCLDCHAGAAKKERAGLPETDTCMLCHTTIKADSPDIEQLAKIHAGDEELNWVRVYEVPDFVFFSHANHLKGGEECATCHGAVEQRDVLAKEVSTSMTTCMNCHAAKDVSNECFFCHQLGH